MSLVQICQSIQFLQANANKSRQFAETLDREFTRVYNHDHNLPSHVALQIIDVMVLKAEEADFFQKLADFLSNFTTIDSPFKNDPICMQGLMEAYARFIQDDVWQQTYWARIPSLIPRIQMTLALIEFCSEVQQPLPLSPYAAQLAEIDSVLEAVHTEPLSPRITEGDLFEWRPKRTTEGPLFEGLDPQFESTPLRAKQNLAAARKHQTGYHFDFKPLFKHQRAQHFATLTPSSSSSPHPAVRLRYTN